MKASDFKIGAQVRQTKVGSIGVVVGNQLSNDRIVAVEWMSGVLSKEDVNDLMVIDLDLEKEFHAIQLKLDQASLALKEINDLTTKLKLGSLADLIHRSNAEGILSPRELFNQLDLAGWNTSSMSC